MAAVDVHVAVALELDLRLLFAILIGNQKTNKNKTKNIVTNEKQEKNSINSIKLKMKSKNDYAKWLKVIELQKKTWNKFTL